MASHELAAHQVQEALPRGQHAPGLDALGVVVLAGQVDATAATSVARAISLPDLAPGRYHATS